MQLKELTALMEQYKQEGGDQDALRNQFEALFAGDTSPLGLRVWKASDKPRMEDFNENYQRLEEEILALRAELGNKADEESGVWTPTIAGSIAVGTPIYQSRSGTYVKFGKIVFINLSLSLTNKGGMEGDIIITGLPFTTNERTACSFGRYNETSLAAGSVLTARIDRTLINLQKANNLGIFNVSAFEINDAFSIMCLSAVYQINE